MEITRDNLLSLIRNGIKRKNLSVLGLEKKSGVPKDTVRDFLRAKTHILRADKLQKILRILEPSRMVPVSGYVGARAQIFPMDSKKEDKPDEVDCPPGFEPSHVIAIRVKSDAMAPVFHEGWIIYYTEKNISVPHLKGGWQVPYNKPGKKAAHKSTGESGEPLAEFFGKPCIVRLKDGRTMLRTLKQGKNPGRYTLVGYNTDDVENAELEWAAKIIFIKTA